MTQRKSVLVIVREFLRERAAVSETILSECAIVDFECNVVMQQVLISEIDSTQL